MKVCVCVCFSMSCRSVPEAGYGWVVGVVFSVCINELSHLENESDRGQRTQLFSHTGQKDALKIDLCSKQ